MKTLGLMALLAHHHPRRAFKIDYFDFHILLTKNKERENSQEIINKLQHLIIYSSVPDNRTYVKCPFCNNLKGFRTIHLMNKDDDLSQLYITLCNRNLKLGNRVILLKNSNDGKIYRIPDIYYHFIIEHHYVPRRWFAELILQTS